MDIRAERGVAMIIAIMAMLLMSALGTALVLTTTTETNIAGNFRNASEALFAADAGLERAMEDVLTVPDWNKLLDGSTQSAFVDGAPSGPRTLQDGSTIDLTQAINMANCQKVTTCSDADMNDTTNRERPWGVNNPRWKLYAYANLKDILPVTDTINSPYYVVVMVADDPSENDGDPSKDGASGTNPGSGVIAMRSEAFGPRGAHKVLEMTLARTDTTELERGYTGQRGQDEQNRRARKAAVQTPGKALTQQTLNTTAGGIQ
jgi:type IV pilus assembly PilX-like protein